MKRKYKTIYLKTIKDFQIAEALKNKDWKIIEVGFESITLEKESVI